MRTFKGLLVFALSALFIVFIVACTKNEDVSISDEAILSMMEYENKERQVEGLVAKINWVRANFYSEQLTKMDLEFLSDCSYAIYLANDLSVQKSDFETLEQGVILMTAFSKAVGGRSIETNFQNSINLTSDYFEMLPMIIQKLSECEKTTKQFDSAFDEMLEAAN